MRKSDWRIEGHLGATVIQPCAITNDPVTTRIETDILRNLVAEFHLPEESEAEMPEDDSIEPLPEHVDLREVILEALALALPDYPRSDGVDLGTLSAAPPGADPLEVDVVKPFAGLADLKKKLEGKD